MNLISKQKKLSFAKSLLCSFGVVFCWGGIIPASLAAKTITIQLGPFEQTLEVNDLENFAKTGKLSKELQAFSSFLTPQVQGLLNQKIQIDPAFADKFIDGLVKTPQGQRLISSLGGILPGSTSQSLKDTLNLTARRVNGLSILGFVRSYPGENITIDARKAVELSLELNANNLQSQAFAAILERETVKDNITLPTNINPGLSGSQQVQLVNLTLQDSQRNRTIPVDIYSPSGTTRKQLIVISHGFGATRRHLKYLAQHLSSHGFPVAVLEHPGSNAIAVNRATNNSNLAKLIDAREFIYRPQDVSFLLNELTKLNLQQSQLQGKLNTQHVTVIGHSLGGYTALALAGGKLDLEGLQKFCRNSIGIGEAPGDWLQCAAARLTNNDIKNVELQDKRIQGAVVLNPLVGNLFSKKGLERINTPVLMLASSDDALTPALKHQFAPFTQLRGSKYLLTAIGGTHLSVSDPTYRTSEISNIVREKRGPETEKLRELVSGVSLAFIKQQTDEAKVYQPFLTPAYAQSLSTPQLRLRLVSELPGNLKKWAEFAAN
ncbi:MAG: alpha/beta hydrolase [Calothrix sp. C42_A2020_038]|nr:alpha/beta hydrolase [Calothrix sp. C42_A2020_038]